MLKNSLRLIPAIIVTALVITGCQTTPKTSQSAPTAVEPAKVVASEDGKTAWCNALNLGLEGQGWHDGIKRPYDRFPGEAEGKVPDPVWGLSRHSAGMNVRFVTDSPTIAIRWSVLNAGLAMPHMPATGVSGVDLYVKDQGRWGWLGIGIPNKKDDNEAVIAEKLPSGQHEYRLYLPLYNGTEKLEIGVKPGSVLAKAPAYAVGHEKPMLFWGSSILQGGCASRPGMAYTSIIGRRMERPVLNFGFSGNGRMDPPVVDLIAKLDVSIYVIDCCPNMSAAEITERTEPLVKTLRAAHPDTPIVLVENVPYEKGWFLPDSKDAYAKKNVALRAAYDRLIAAGVKDLSYIPCTDLFGHDQEATVDGVHPNDLGFLRMADAIEPYLRKVLHQKAK